MKIILVRGLAASGKSTLAKALFEYEPSSILWSKDVYFDEILDAGVQRDIANKLVYDILYQFLARNSNSDVQVFVDAPYWHLDHVKIMQDFCRKNGISLQTVLVICSDEGQWRERFARRGADPSPNQVITDYDAMKEYYGSMYVQPLKGEPVYDSALGGDAHMKEVLDYIR